MTGPSALTANIIKNIESSSIVVQWDAVDDSLPTIYTVTWTDHRDLNGVDTLDEQTSYTITGLTLDTVYTITVSAANRCDSGPEFRTSVSLSTDITSTTTTISPTVSNPMSVTSTINPVSIIRSATNTAASAITTTNSMSAAVSRDTGSTIKSTTSVAAPSSHLGSTIATCTTLIKCFGMYCYYHYCFVTYNLRKLSIRT